MKNFPTRQLDFGPYIQTQRIVPVMTRTVASSSSAHSAWPAVTSAFWGNSTGLEMQITAHVTGASPVREARMSGSKEVPMRFWITATSNGTT